MYINLTIIKVSLGNGIVQVKRSVEMAFLQAVVFGTHVFKFPSTGPRGTDDGGGHLSVHILETRTQSRGHT